jgi:hypothetical protein
MPFGKDGMGSRRELHARISLPPDALVEFVQLHRNDVPEHVAFEFGQYPMG